MATMRDVLGRTLITGDKVWWTSRVSGVFRLCKYKHTKTPSADDHRYHIYLCFGKSTFTLTEISDQCTRLLKASNEDIKEWNAR